MYSNCHSNNITRKNLCNKIISVIQYKPFDYDKTSSESRSTSRDRIPLEMASHSSLIMTLYSTTLLDDGQRHTPLRDTKRPSCA